MRAAGSVFIASVSRSGNQRGVAPAVVPATEPQQEIVRGSRGRQRNDCVGAERRRHPQRATPCVVLRVLAMPGRARRAGVEHLDGRVGRDVEDDQALTGDLGDLDFRHIAGGQQLAPARQLHRKVSIFRDLPQSLEHPRPVDDAADQRPVDELHHEVAARQGLALADVPHEIGFDRRRPGERSPLSRSSPRPCPTHR